MFVVRTKVTKMLSRQAIQETNPNIEIQDKPTDKQVSNPENPKHRIRSTSVCHFICFSYLKLFRISDFVLRTFCSWRHTASNGRRQHTDAYTNRLSQPGSF